MRKITEIIIHCAATRPQWLDGRSTTAKVKEIRRWHVDGNGWSDIGYHYLIDRDGTVKKGRDIGRNGAHTRGHNRGTIGICLIGGHGSTSNDDFLDNYTRNQETALRELLQKLQQQHSVKKVSGHNNYAAKACPGFDARAWWSQQLQPSYDDLLKRVQKLEAGICC